MSDPRTNVPVILLPAYAPFQLTRIAAATRAAILERAAVRAIERCRGNLRRLPIDQAELAQDYMHARMQSGAF